MHVESEDFSSLTGGLTSGLVEGGLGITPPPGLSAGNASKVPAKSTQGGFTTGACAAQACSEALVYQHQESQVLMLNVGRCCPCQ